MKLQITADPATASVAEVRQGGELIFKVFPAYHGLTEARKREILGHLLLWTKTELGALPPVTPREVRMSAADGLAILFGVLAALAIVGVPVYVILRMRRSRRLKEKP